MRYNHHWLLMGLSLLIITCLACSDDQGTNPAPDKVAVAGQVHIYECNIRIDTGDPEDQNSRFSYRTGDTARVSFVDTTSGSVVSSVCDSSGFTVSVDPGIYDIVVETGFTFPDTIKAVEIVRDTTVKLQLLYDWHMADSIFADFSWAPLTDSIGEVAEREWLDTLALIAGGGMIEPESAVREVHFGLDSNVVTIRYRVPIGSNVETWQVAQRALQIQGIWRAVIPGLSGFMVDFRPCLMENSRVGLTNLPRTQK